MNRYQKAIVGSVLGLTILGGVVGGAAADPNPQATATPAAYGRGPAMADGGAMVGHGFGFQGVHDQLASLLKLSAEEIEAKREAGQSLAQIAAAQGVSEQQLTDALLAARKAALDTRVQAGTITQAQADAAYAQMASRVKESVQRTEVGPNRPTDGETLGMGWGRGSGQPGIHAPGTGLESGQTAPTGAGRGMRWAR